MIRKGQVRWLPKDDVCGQIQFIREAFGLKVIEVMDAGEVGEWFGFRAEPFLQDNRTTR
jgi:hypothetical protein